jgi:integrase
MVSDKIPLIRLLRSTDNAVTLWAICQRLSDFSKQVSQWVKSKLNGYAQQLESPPAWPERKRKVISLDRAWQDFSEWKKWTDKQAKANQRMFDNLRLFLGNRDVRDITKRHLKTALEGISQLPQRNKKQYNQIPLEKLPEITIPDEDRVSGKYVKEHLKLAQSFFSSYLKHEADLIQVSPSEGVSWDYENRRFGCLTDSEVIEAIEKAKFKPEWFRWFLLMAAYSGARRSEIAALTKDDIKLCPDTKRYYFVVKEGKTKAARRTVPIHNHLIENGLFEWIESCNYRIFNTAYENLNRVTDLFGSILVRKLNDHGERLVFHSLRHTFITKARAFGISNVLVQQIVGHEKNGAGQTDRYTHTFQLKDVLKVIDCIGYS